MNQIELFLESLQLNEGLYLFFRCNVHPQISLPIKKEFILESPEEGLGTLLPCVPFSTVVEAESYNPGPLCSKRRTEEVPSL